PPITLDAATEGKGLAQWFKLRLQIGVGGQFFTTPVPGTTRWSCPAMIVDYVKVYEKAADVSGLKECTEETEMKRGDEEKLMGLCEFAQKSSSSIVINPNLVILVLAEGIFRNIF